MKGLNRCLLRCSQRLIIDPLPLRKYRSRQGCNSIAKVAANRETRKLASKSTAATFIPLGGASRISGTMGVSSGLRARMIVWNRAVDGPSTPGLGNSKRVPMIRITFVMDKKIAWRDQVRRVEIMRGGGTHRVGLDTEDFVATLDKFLDTSGCLTFVHCVGFGADVANLSVLERRSDSISNTTFARWPGKQVA